MADIETKSPLHRLLKPLIFTIILGVFTYSAIIIYGDAKSIKGCLENFKWHYFAIALLLASVNYAFRFFKWEYYLKCLEIKLPVIESILTFLSGFTVVVTPVKMGEVIKSFLMKQARGISIARTAPIVVAERLTDMIAIILLCMTGYSVTKSNLIFIFISSIILFFLILIISCRKLGKKVIRILTTLPLVKKVGDKINETYESTYLVANPKRLLIPTFFSIIAWGSECVAFHVLIKGMGIKSITILHATFIYAFSTLAGAFAMVPGGLGVTEGGLTGLLIISGKNLSPAGAAAVTILTRAATLWFAIFIGIISITIYTYLYLSPKSKVEKIKKLV